MKDTPIILTEALTKVYGRGDAEVRALDRVDVRIDEGEFVAIMGPSGSGKSTLMNILGCLDRPTEGKYFLAGEDVSQMDKNQLADIRNKRLGFIFQSYNLLAQTTALENVMLPMLYARNGSLTTDQQKEKALKSLTMVGLADRVDHKPQELSGGQMQRVAIARALINDPLLILADEPTGNLDSRSGVEIMELLQALHNEGRTIVMVTHDDDIARYADRTIRFKDGQVDVDQRNGERKKTAQTVQPQTASPQEAVHETN
ncbi:MAG: ABC transporter ATP-binding protein [Anaerolineales bacterium]